MGKILSYKLLGTALKSLADACFKADEQQRNGEVITACGMSDDDLDRLYASAAIRHPFMG